MYVRACVCEYLRNGESGVPLYMPRTRDVRIIVKVSGPTMLVGRAGTRVAQHTQLGFSQSDSSLWPQTVDSMCPWRTLHF